MPAPSMRVLVLRHHEEDSPGLLGEAFAAYGAAVETHLYPEEGPLPDLDGYDHLVILGSNASVYDDADWITAEVDWLRRVPVPVLGICFGAQLLAASSGGSVERAPAFELGWVQLGAAHESVDTRSPATNGHRDVPAIGPGPWFQFHGDRCVLPSTARLLAQNDVGVQAFTVGRSLGVQFHPEVDVAQLERWFEKGGRKTAERVGKDPDALLERTAREEPDARVRAHELVRTYVAFASGLTQQPARSPRSGTGRDVGVSR